MNHPVSTHKNTDITRIVFHVLVALLAATVLASMIGHIMIGLNHDHLSLMHTTTALLDGKTPYEGYADINPPLIHLIYAFPTLIAQITPLSDYIALNLWVTAIMLLSLTCCFKLLDQKHTTYAKFVIILCLATALTVISFHHQVFADRDHIFFTLIMPWLLLNAPLCEWKSAPRKWRYIAAFMAALAMALKPYFMLLYPILILFAASHTPIKKQLKLTEHHIIWCCAGVYLCVIGLFFGKYFSEQFLLVLYTYPHYSWSDNAKLATLANLFEQLWPTLLLFTAACIASKDNKRLLAYVMLLQLSGIAIYWFNAGWYYTQYTLLATNMLMQAASGYILLTSFSSNRILKIILYIMLIALFYITHAQAAYTRAITDINSQKTRGHPISFVHIRSEANDELKTVVPENAKFMFLSTHVRSLSVAAQNPTFTPVGRYDHLWPLPGLAKMSKNPRNEKLHTLLQKRFVRGITSDIMVEDPDYIVVEVSPRQPPLPMDYNITQYLRQYHPFNVIMSRYRKFRVIDTCDDRNHLSCAFKIFKHEKYMPSCKHRK